MRKTIGTFLIAVLLATPLTDCSKALQSNDAGNLTDSIATLASGGVAVTEDVTSTTPLVTLAGPPSAMRFTRWELHNLLAEANAHNGYLGSELDAFVRPPPGVPPLTAIIGAWLTRHQGPLAENARRIMGDQDYQHAGSIVFPTIVVLTFIADIARVNPSAQVHRRAFDLGPWIASPAQADGVCSDVSNWVSTVVNNVNSAVQANGSSWLASIWNVVVSIAGKAFSIVVNGVLQSLTGFVTEVATVTATLMHVASMFKPWTVALAANPPALTLGTAPTNGSFDATLSAQDVPWPTTLAGCVQTLTGLNVTDASYKHAKIVWSHPVGIPGLADSTSQDATLLDDKTAHYRYATVTRAAVTDCPRLVPSGPLGITVDIKRTDVSKVIDSLVKLITNRLPPKLQSFLESYEQSAIDKGKEAIGEFKGPHANAKANVSEYVADPLCSSSPPPGPDESAAPLPASRTAYQLPFVACDDILSRVNLAASYPGSVQLNSYMRPTTRTFYRNLMASLLQMAHVAQVPTQGLENQPRIAEQTGCAIGPPYTPPADINIPDDPPIKALFIVQPTEGRPPNTAESNAQCLSAIGPELTAFDAECWIINGHESTTGSSTGTMIFVFTKSAEYVTETIGGGNAMLLLRDILRSLERNPGATPQPSPDASPP